MKGAIRFKTLLGLLFILLFSIVPAEKTFAQTNFTTPINGNNWSFVAVTENGRYYYFKHHGNTGDSTWYKSLIQISDEQFNRAAEESFLTFARKDGQSFALPSETKLYESESDSIAEIAGKIFTKIYFAHHQGYRYFLLNGDPTRAANTEGVVWSLDLQKDWVIEDTPGFGGDSFAVDSIYLHYLCEFNGNGHKIYPTADTGYPLISIIKPTNLPTDYTDYYVKIKNVTLDGTDSKSGGFNIQSGRVLFDSNVTVENCTFDKSSSYNGAGISLREGELTINPGNIIRNCTAKKTGNSGAILLGSNVTLNLNGAEFYNNSAIDGDGGAICSLYTNSKINIKDSIFENNTSKRYGGAIFSRSPLEITGGRFKSNSAKYGGAIYSYNIANIKNTLIENNSASSYGGGIYSYFKKDTEDTTILLDGVTISNNATLQDQNSNTFGGGVYLENSTNASIKNSTIENNSSKYGGGIALYATTLHTDNSKIQGNISTLAGGIYMGRKATSNIANSLIAENKAHWGGGVMAFSGTLNIINSSLEKNDAYRGGGIQMSGGTLNINNSTLKENTSLDFGGGVYIYNDNSTIVNNSTMVGNTALYGGGVAADGATLTVDNSAFEENIARTDSDDSDAGQGGGILLTGEKSVLKMKNSTVKNNSARYGAGVELLEGEGEFSGVEFNTNNTSQTDDTLPGGRHGGGLYVFANARAIIKDNSKFIGNKANWGGAVYTSQNSTEDPIPLSNPIADTDPYQNLSIDNSTYFKDNVGVNGLYLPPENFKDFTNLEFSEDSDVAHSQNRKSLLNNYDVYYKNEKGPVSPTPTNPTIPIIPIMPIIKPLPKPVFPAGQILISEDHDYESTNKETETHLAYMEGYDDGEIKAERNLTRAEAAAIVSRLVNLDLNNKSKPNYADVVKDAWYLPYINAALNHNMLDAEKDKIRPDDKITRAEFANMLAQIDKDNDYVSDFSDIKGHRYEAQINKIYGNKRIIGYEDGSFRPNNLLTRAEAATILNRMFNRVADEIALADLQSSAKIFPDMNKSDWFYWEIVEASNDHHLVRRALEDEFNRTLEQWISIFKNSL